MGLPSLCWFPRWPGWSWGRPSRPLTSSRDRDVAPLDQQVHTFSLGSSGSRAGTTSRHRQPHSHPRFRRPAGKEMPLRPGLTRGARWASWALPGSTPPSPRCAWRPTALLRAASLPLPLSLSLLPLSYLPWSSAPWLGVGDPHRAVESVCFPPVRVVICEKTRDSSQWLAVITEHKD